MSGLALGTGSAAIVPELNRRLEADSGPESYTWRVDFDPDNLGDLPDTVTDLNFGYTITTNQLGFYDSISHLVESVDEIETTQDFDVFLYYAQVTGQHTIDVDGTFDGLDVQLRIYDQNGDAITLADDPSGIPVNFFNLEIRNILLSHATIKHEKDIELSAV